MAICQQQLHKMQGFSGIAVSHWTFYLNRKYAVTKPCISCSCKTLAEILKKTYMKQTFSLLLILLSSLVYSQKELVSIDIDKFCYKFKIENEKIVGNGYEILNNKISESQFILLGEQHFASEISLFTNSLILLLSKNNFKYFVAEIGPNSSKKLVSEIQKKGQLFDFNTKYNDLTGEIPIPFFDGKEGQN